MKKRSEVQAEAPATEATSERKLRGFSLLAEEQHKAIASKGGKAAHSKGVAHEFTPEEASAAGRKGGLASASIPGHMAEIGRKGAKARIEKEKLSTQEEGQR